MTCVFPLASSARVSSGRLSVIRRSFTSSMRPNPAWPHISIPGLVVGQNRLFIRGEKGERVR